MMLLTITKSKEVVLQFLVHRVLRVGIHWIGRSVLCSGDDCPACGLRMARDVFYAGVGFQRQRRVVELPSSFAVVVDEACRELHRDDALGIVLRATRSSVRDVWKLRDCKLLEPLSTVFRANELASELARCWRVPVMRDGEDLQMWLKRVAVSQRSLLAQSQLFV